jgi:hypothetical protein
MHSFDNGSALSVKQDNWKQLMRFFKKMEIPFNTELIDDIIHCKSGSVVIFINEIYSLLTQRRIIAPPEKYADYIDPRFARPTASNVLHNRARQPDLSKTTDIAITEEKLSETLEMHEKILQEEKILNPERFGIGNPKERTVLSKSTSPKVITGKNKAVGADDREAKVTVKQVEVKSIDRNIAKLRASSTEQSPLNVGNKEAAPSSSLVSTLQNIISSVLVSSGVINSHTSFSDLVSAFVTSVKIHYGYKTHITVENFEMTDEVAKDVFAQVTNKIPTISDNILSTPSEFSLFLYFISELLECAPLESEFYNAVVEATVAVGKQCCQCDALASSKLFMEYGFRAIYEIISKVESKRRAALKITFSFFKDDVESHVNAIYSLKKSLTGDINLFLSCLSLCIYMEYDLNPRLLDLYLYYCIIGLVSIYLHFFLK